MYVIAGASGSTGKIVVQELLSNAKKVKVIGRDAGHLKPLADRGAEPLSGDLTDGGFLKKAFSGAEAVYILLPPNPKSDNFRAYQNTISDNYVDAIKSNAWEIEDSMKELLHKNTLASVKQDPLAFIKTETLFGDLAQSERFVTAYLSIIEGFRKYGAEIVMRYIDQIA